MKKIMENVLKKNDSLQKFIGNKIQYLSSSELKYIVQLNQF